MKRKIFFDLDGTLIDSSQRMYTLFCKLNTNCKMCYNEYWNIKKQGISQKQMLMSYFNYSENKCEEFHNNWMNNIENDDLLLLDKLFVNTIKILIKLIDNNDLFVATARQKKDSTIKELENLKIAKFFKSILITEQTISKDKIIRNNILDIDKNDVIIGDTIEDIDTGVKLGIRKFGISTGMLSYNKLLSYNPDKVYSNLSEFCKDIC